MEKRVEFSNQLTEMSGKATLHFTKLFFSDEANFYVGGYVNQQNFQYWSSENPHLTETKSL